MIECFCCGPYQTNVWMCTEEKTKECLLIDAAPGSFDLLSKRLKGWKIHLFLTHGHWDHIADVGLFQKQLNAKVYMSSDDKFWLDEKHQIMIIPKSYRFCAFLPDVNLNGGEHYKLAGKEIEIISVPGHTQGHIALYCEADQAVFVGDTLFKNGVGRTDLPGGNFETLKISLSKLFALPENIQGMANVLH